MTALMSTMYYNNNLGGTECVDSGYIPTNGHCATVPPNHSDTNLYIRRLPLKIDDDELRSSFEPYGTVISAAVMRNIQTGVSLGNAFVRFEKHEEALAAIMAFDGRALGNRTISVQWARKRHDVAIVGEAAIKVHKLFMRNIPRDVTEEDLYALLSPYGTIVRISLHDDTIYGRLSHRYKHTFAERQSTQGRRIAFVTYEEDGASLKARTALHNTRPFPSCGSISIMAKLAEDVRQRTARRASPTPGLSDGTPIENNHEMDALFGDVPPCDSWAQPVPQDGCFFNWKTDAPVLNSPTRHFPMSHSTGGDHRQYSVFPSPRLPFGSLTSAVHGSYSLPYPAEHSNKTVVHGSIELPCYSVDPLNGISHTVPSMGSTHQNNWCMTPSVHHSPAQSSHCGITRERPSRAPSSYNNSATTDTFGKLCASSFGGSIHSTSTRYRHNPYNSLTSRDDLHA